MERKMTNREFLKCLPLKSVALLGFGAIAETEKPHSYPRQPDLKKFISQFIEAVAKGTDYGKFFVSLTRFKRHRMWSRYGASASAALHADIAKQFLASCTRLASEGWVEWKTASLSFIRPLGNATDEELEGVAIGIVSGGNITIGSEFISGAVVWEDTAWKFSEPIISNVFINRG